MGVTIFWTDFAKEELKKIYSYHKAVASKNLAKKLVIGLQTKTQILSNHPDSGHKEELLENRKQQFRYLVFKNYKIIYWLNLEKNHVEIVDVFDCRQNPVKIKRSK